MMKSPYKFLDFYGINDRNIFFGRERETNILLADVIVNRLVVLFARTGTGKTSLINAGVRPRLEERGFRTFYIRVERHPTEAARDVLIRERLLDENDEATSFSEQLISLVNKLEKPIVLFFDQFEEFFIQIKEEKTRRQFVSDIANIYRNGNSGVHFVFSMREEYFHEMDQFRSEIPSIFHKNSNLRLLQLTAKQAEFAIIKPAQACGVEVEDALTVKLIQDLMEVEGIGPTNLHVESIRPTNLQIVCDTLWGNKDRSKEKKITLKEYEEDLKGAQYTLNQRLSGAIEKVLLGTDLLPLMQKLIPELHTEKDTKYPRVFSDLVKTLNTSEKVLEDLVTRLKSVQILNDTTISGAYGIEWASDYLAERTKLIGGLVKTIELRGILQAAMTKKIAGSADLETDTPKEASSNVPYLSADDLEQFSQNTEYLTNLSADEVEFLFDTALFHQRNMQLWFDLISTSKPNPLDILSKRIHDNQADINLRKAAIKLLGDIKTDQALHLLEEALDEPDLSDKSIDAIIEFPGDQAVQLLAKSLERDDLWETFVFALAGSGTKRAVSLLSPFLQRNDKFFQTLGAFERLAKFRSEIGNLAIKVIKGTIPVLEAMLKQDEYFFQALNALERLTRMSDEVGDLATKALEATIPILESMLSDDSRSAQATSALASLAKLSESLNSMAQNAIKTSNVITPIEQILERKGISEQIKEFVSEDITIESGAKSSLPSLAKIIDFKDEIIQFIDDGSLVPVISNSFRIEQIFRDEEEFINPLLAESYEFIDEIRTISDDLTKAWARSMNYPFADDHDLASVAQYNGTIHYDLEFAKRGYLTFLKNVLLKLAEEDGAYQEQSRELRNRRGSMRFSEVVQWLDYPRFPDGVKDPLRLLARLPMPIYITTSYFAFIEDALIKEGKEPNTQVLNLGRRTKIKQEHLPNRDYEPTPVKPVVYHLFGLEDYANTLVLSEDDHMNFLMNSASAISSMEMIPSPLRDALSQSRLVLFGYNLRSWDFRTLFQFIRELRKPPDSPMSIVLQFKPTLENKDFEERSLSYLEKYFGGDKFKVMWIDAERFIYGLSDAWQNRG